MLVNKIYNVDCLDGFKKLENKSIDLILTDPPYGTTSCKWDIIIPFDEMWNGICRIIKSGGVIVLFGQEPFSSHLRLSNLDWWKYDWIWRKNNAANVMQAKRAPLKYHEIISVFSEEKLHAQGNMIYHPQGLIEINKHAGGKIRRGDVHGIRQTKKYIQKYTNYPKSILEFDLEKGKRLHPTQKPTALLEYLILTYTNVGETVLDFAMGSGSTGVACLNTGRDFIGFEINKEYVDMAYDRINEH